MQRKKLRPRFFVFCCRNSSKYSSGISPAPNSRDSSVSMTSLLAKYSLQASQTRTIESSMPRGAR